jgi:hypothetical protein
VNWLSVTVPCRSLAEVADQVPWLSYCAECTGQTQGFTFHAGRYDVDELPPVLLKHAWVLDPVEFE